MPELPEVETIRKSLLALEGQRLLNVRVGNKHLRTNFSFEPFLKQRLQTLSRIGKTLVWEFETPFFAHLGMTGRFCLNGKNLDGTKENETKESAAFYYDHPRLPVHDHITFTFENHTLIYNDIRRFGYFTDKPPQGVDPFTPENTPERLFALAQKTSRDMKAFLMDQKTLEGLGNIYVCEALFLAQINPHRSANTLTNKECERLHHIILEVLEKAITLGGSTLRDYANANGEKGQFQDEFFVYGRKDQPCLNCNTPLKHAKQGGRSTVFCPSCQS